MIKKKRSLTNPGPSTFCTNTGKTCYKIPVAAEFIHDNKGILMKYQEILNIKRKSYVIVDPCYARCWVSRYITRDSSFCVVFNLYC